MLFRRCFLLFFTGILRVRRVREILEVFKGFPGFFEEKKTKFGAPTPGLLLAKYSAEKTKYIDVSQPPHQGDELKRPLNRR